MVVVKMKTIAETYLGYDVKDAVITMPSYLSDSQGKSTKDVIAIAGLNIIRNINQLTTTAIAYGFNIDVQLSKENMAILIFDLGGILAARCGVPNLKVVFEVDVDGIMKVYIEEEVSDVGSHIVIVKDSGRLTKEEIERMLRDAERF